MKSPPVLYLLMLWSRTAGLLNAFQALTRSKARLAPWLVACVSTRPLEGQRFSPAIRHASSAHIASDRPTEEDGGSALLPSTETAGDPGVDSATTLRPYQETAVSACLSALSAGLTRIGVSSPTGSGKTTMFMSLIPRVETTEQRSRVLILVGSVELASQAENAAKRILREGWRVEVEQGKRVASGTADM